jgi:hypothetical protein
MNSKATNIEFKGTINRIVIAAALIITHLFNSYLFKLLDKNLATANQEF